MSNQNNSENNKESFEVFLALGSSLLINTAYLLFSSATNSTIDIGSMIGLTLGSFLFPTFAVVGATVSIPIIGYSTAKLLFS
jgi:hypothetical protein